MKILLITPPFTQLNTPYPATAYLKGFLEGKSHTVKQVDLGNAVALKLFSSKGLQRLYKDLEASYKPGEYAGLDRFISLKESYLSTIDPVASFLKGENTNASYRINSGRWLPEGDRSTDLPAGSTVDDARHRATLYIEEIGDIISAYCDDFYGFSRYAERLALSPPSFQPLEAELKKPASLIRTISREILEEILKVEKPEICGFSVPFPGNLLGALDSANYIKENYSSITTIMGGGYINTELRELKEPAVFRYMDYITLDDGERPFLQICRFLNGEIEKKRLVRTFSLSGEGLVEYHTGTDPDFSLRDLPAPDFKDLLDQPYFSLLPLSNPMHRLWSDGKWNKMTLAHGCYWHRCAFCDTSLDYISRFDPDKASLIADKMETMIARTGIRGFHFVDEAAPPALLRDLAVELIRRDIHVSWWTNIRFEKNFTPDLCRLLAKSGCIAVSGGLEVASDRLLEKMDKGVTVPQVAAVAGAFHRSGILVHTYLMYGFPGQTEQELIDAMENVRQLFSEGLIDSAFWHQFALTAHSPVGRNPDFFGVKIDGPEKGNFARNDLEFRTERTYNPDDYSSGLSTALHSWMKGKNLNSPVKNWFTFKTPKPRIKKDYIHQIMEENIKTREINDQTRLLWTGAKPLWKEGLFELHDTDGAEQFPLGKNEWIFLSELLEMCHIRDHNAMVLNDLDELCSRYSMNTDAFLSSTLLPILSAYGLLLL